MKDFETVPARVNQVINEVIHPYFKEEDWEDLEPRLQGELDEIFSDAANLELKNELGFMHMIIAVNFIVMILLIVLLFVWTNNCRAVCRREPPGNVAEAETAFPHMNGGEPTTTCRNTVSKAIVGAEGI